MAWAPDYLDDGDPANAGSVNDPLADGVAWVNGMGRAAFTRGAINYVQAAQPLSEYKTTGFTKEGDSGRHNYSRSVFGASLNYSAFGTDGGSDSSGVYTGDRTIVGHPDATGAYSDGLAQLSMQAGGVRVDMGGDDRCIGILVLFNVNVVRFFFPDAVDFEAMFCIQYKTLGDATWRTVSVSERFISLKDHVIEPDGVELVDIDVPIATLITKDTITSKGGTTASDPIMGIRAMMSLKDSVSGAFITLDRWNLTALALHASLE